MTNGSIFTFMWFAPVGAWESSVHEAEVTDCEYTVSSNADVFSSKALLGVNNLQASGGQFRGDSVPIALALHTHKPLSR